LAAEHPVSDPATPRPVEDEASGLAARIAAGEEAALQELHQRYAPLVFHVACRALDRAAAEEVTQDVFLAVWRKAADFDPERGTLKTWLLGIARNRILDELRARSRRPVTDGFGLEDPLAFTAPDPLPDELAWHAFRRRAIAEALSALPEPQARALRLAFFAELSQERVAELLAIPLGTAKTRIRAGLRGMSSRLAVLVAGFLLLLAAPGLWLLRRGPADRAVDLLANSSLRVLKLLPPGAAGGVENGLHAAWRGIPGRDTVVLTLTHFPAPPRGSRYLLWVRQGADLAAVALPAPDGAGKALVVLDGALPRRGWPTELVITLEPGRPQTPNGPVVARWAP
jgi:RNA polymerase sigma-70 factor (ECF subfamily)